MVVDRKVRVLVAKPGLDGHDVGAKVVARSLKEAGFDVTYTGLRKSPEEIVRRAQDLDVDVIGLSLLSGSHLSFCRRLRALRKEHGLNDVLLLVGGVIPEKDRQALKDLGVDGIFPAGTPLDSVAEFIRTNVS